MSIELLSDGLHFGEGPRWHNGKLWFSDFFDHAVKTVDTAGNVESKVPVAGQPSELCRSAGCPRGRHDGARRS